MTFWKTGQIEQAVTANTPENSTNLQDSVLSIGFPIEAVIHDGNMPMFVLANGGLGYAFRISFVNGRSWDEGKREQFMAILEKTLRLESGSQDARNVTYTYSFTVVRKKLSDENITNMFYDYIRTFNNKPRMTDAQCAKFAEKWPLTSMRLTSLRDMANRLVIQNLDIYCSVVGTPAQNLIDDHTTFIESMYRQIDKPTQYEIDSRVMGTVVKDFKDQVRRVLSGLNQAKIPAVRPQSEAALLRMVRAAWRPNYEQPGGVAAELASLKEGAYATPSDFLMRDMGITHWPHFWIADGAVHFILSMDEAPNPAQAFSSRFTDKFLQIGFEEGTRPAPFLGSYTVAFSSMSRVAADSLFKKKTLFANLMAGDGQGLSRDRIGEQEAANIEEQYMEFIAGSADLVNLSCFYHYELPIEYLKTVMGDDVSETDLVVSAEKLVRQILEGIGDSQWVVERQTWQETFQRSMPGVTALSTSFSLIPRLYSTLEAALHLVPFYNAVTGERFNGSNFFVTDTNTMFVFDHFAKMNGPAANFTVCGGTGSGKSNTVQNLIMMLEPLDPIILILDIGGGGVGSWSKLVKSMGGKEIAFSDPVPPKINPFELNTTEAMPNMRKKSSVLDFMQWPEVKENFQAIDNVYTFLIGEQGGPKTPKELQDEIEEKFLLGYKIDNFTEFQNELALRPGFCKPGEKGLSAIKMVLELILSTTVRADGTIDGPAWLIYKESDINAALTYMYESWMPPAERDFSWPTVSDFREAVRSLQDERQDGSDLNAMGEIYNFVELINTLSTFCMGGVNEYLDGQSNVEIRERYIDPNTQREEMRNARVVLCDMAGLDGDQKKLAIMMVLVNEFMANILANAKGRKGVMIRDEAWFFLRSKLAANYLELDYRTARKMGYSTVTIAQQLEDFLKSSVVNANTQNWLVCGLGSEREIALAAEKFKFSHEERAMFESKLMGLQTVRNILDPSAPPDAYVNVLISNASGNFFLRVRLSKAERWLTTTDPEETLIINYYKNRRKTPMVELCVWLATGEYLKDAELQEFAHARGRQVKRM